MKIAIPQECCQHNTGTKIVCTEKGRKITFFNPNHKNVFRYMIDGCEGLRSSLENKSCKLCDFLVVDWRTQEHYVELKGADVERALQQLESTIVQLRDGSSEARSYCWIMTTESPSTQSKFQVLKEKFEKRFNVRLTIRTNQYQHNLE